MIALPIKSDKEESALAPLFGKAKWFAFVREDGTISIMANQAEGGIKTARWFESLGVKVLITNHLGEKPFQALQKAGIRIYFAGKERTEVAQAVLKFHEGALVEVDAQNYQELLGEEEKKEHGCQSEAKGAFRTHVKCCQKPKNPLLKTQHEDAHHHHGMCHHHDH